MYNELIRDHERSYMLPARQHDVGYIPVLRGFTYDQHCGVIRRSLLRYNCFILFYSVLSHCSVPLLKEGYRSVYIKPHNPTSKIHQHPIGCRYYTSHRCDDKHCVERRIAVLIVISTIALL